MVCGRSLVTKIQKLRLGEINIFQYLSCQKQCLLIQLDEQLRCTDTKDGGCELSPRLQGKVFIPVIQVRSSMPGQQAEQQLPKQLPYITEDALGL